MHTYQPATTAPATTARALPARTATAPACYMCGHPVAVAPAHAGYAHHHCGRCGYATTARA